jgi:hypothetical protein
MEQSGIVDWLLRRPNQPYPGGIPQGMGIGR